MVGHTLHTYNVHEYLEIAPGSWRQEGGLHHQTTSPREYVCVYVCVYACMYVCMYMHVCIMHVYVYAWTRDVCMYVCREGDAREEDLREPRLGR